MGRGAANPCGVWKFKPQMEPGAHSQPTQPPFFSTSSCIGANLFPRRETLTPFHVLLHVWLRWEGALLKIKLHGENPKASGSRFWAGCGLGGAQVPSPAPPTATPPEAV